MKTIYAHPGQALMLGRRGENEARQIVFDLTAWQELYGEGVAQLIHQRAGDDIPYPIVVSKDNNAAIWILTDTDTAVEGEGKAELQYLVGDQLAKSCTWQTFTDAALGDPTTEAPEPEKAWVDQVLAAGTTAQQAAQRAEEVAAQLNDVEEQVKAASAAASSAQTSAANASASEKNASDSATRAENAAQGVENTLAELEAAMAAI